MSNRYQIIGVSFNGDGQEHWLDRLYPDTPLRESIEKMAVPLVPFYERVEVWETAWNGQKVKLLWSN